jgi:glycosyltransferase involved in cell wall biosynthesis
VTAYDLTRESEVIRLYHETHPSVVAIPDLQPEFYPGFFRKELLTWARRRALVQAGEERVQDFSWKRTARETLKILEEAAANGATGSDS